MIDLRTQTDDELGEVPLYDRLLHFKAELLEMVEDRVDAVTVEAVGRWLGDLAAKYSPDQLRDSHGRWTKEPHPGQAVAARMTAAVRRKLEEASKRKVPQERAPAGLNVATEPEPPGGVIRLPAGENGRGAVTVQGPPAAYNDPNPPLNRAYLTRLLNMRANLYLGGPFNESYLLLGHRSDGRRGSTNFIWNSVHDRNQMVTSRNRLFELSAWMFDNAWSSTQGRRVGRPAPGWLAAALRRADGLPFTPGDQERRNVYHRMIMLERSVRRHPGIRRADWIRAIAMQLWIDNEGPLQGDGNRLLLPRFFYQEFRLPQTTPNLR